MIFVDSNVVVDLLEDTGTWSEWSKDAMLSSDDGSVVADVIVLAEVASAFATVEAAVTYFGAAGIALLPIDPPTAFRASIAHRAYRRAGGQRQAILADFMIGAHAATLGATLITRDRQRFATYFPELPLITPEAEND